MRAMSRNLKPSAGTILLNGKNLFKTNTKAVARTIAVLSQNNRIMSEVTVRTLVQYGRYAYQDWWRGKSKEDEDIVDWAIEKASLQGFEDRKLSTMSGGEQQRAWIAMSIAQKPKLLLLDEPTTFLDISHQLEIMELVTRLNREDGITIVMVLHDINHAARFADELLVINNHRVFMQGDPWKVLESNVLEKVFRVDAEITRDSQSEKPIFYARKVVR
jgi:iron complex transport system ATP-binding protein